MPSFGERAFIIYTTSRLLFEGDYMFTLKVFIFSRMISMYARSKKLMNFPSRGSVSE